MDGEAGDDVYFGEKIGRLLSGRLTVHAHRVPHTGSDLC